MKLDNKILYDEEIYSKIKLKNCYEIRKYNDFLLFGLAFTILFELNYDTRYIGNTYYYNTNFYIIYDGTEYKISAKKRNSILRKGAEHISNYREYVEPFIYESDGMYIEEGYVDDFVNLYKHENIEHYNLINEFLDFEKKNSGRIFYNIKLSFWIVLFVASLLISTLTVDGFVPAFVSATILWFPLVFGYELLNMHHVFFYNKVNPFANEVYSNQIRYLVTLYILHIIVFIFSLTLFVILNKNIDFIVFSIIFFMPRYIFFIFKILPLYIKTKNS
jgi:hypothetical protein